MSLNYEKQWGSDNKFTGQIKPLNNKTIYLGKVISNVDPKNLNRLKVRLDGLDDSVLNANLIYSYPLLDKFFNILPKKGEIVRIIISDINYPSIDGNRFWVGPIISNYANIKEETYKIGDNINVTDKTFSELSENNIKEEQDVFPTTDKDVTILGRNNTDIIQSDDKVTIRAGKHLKNNPKQKNNKNPVYDVLEYVSEDLGYKLSVGDKILLVTHDGKNRFNKIINKDDIDNILNQSQSMLFGELTVDYMKLLTNAFLEHIHQHPQSKPINNKLIKQLTEKLSTIEELLAKNIKIN